MSGKRILLSGNEALAHGAWEAGVRLAAGHTHLDFASINHWACSPVLNPPTSPDILSTSTAPC